MTNCRKLRVATVLLMLIVINCSANVLYTTPGDSIKLLNLHKNFSWINNPLDYSIDKKGSLKITAKKGTDIYHYAGGGFDINTAPMLVFKADSNFIFSTSVSVGLEGQYDGGFLILYSDSTHYSKLLIEKNHKGKTILCSSNTNRYSDDNIHFELKESKLYLKIAKSGELYGFYYSYNGDDWEYLRFFRFDNNSNPIMLGFGVQSPISNKCTAIFSDLSYFSNGFIDGMTGK